MSCGEQRLSNVIMYKKTPPDAALHPEVFCFMYSAGHGQRAVKEVLLTTMFST